MISLVPAIADHVDRCAADSGVRVLVLTGAGRAFCAGLDLREIDSDSFAGANAHSDPVLALQRFPHPVIGAINGPAVTGGLELALACDVLIAFTQARFADTHARVGVVPGWGLSQKLPRLIGIGRAKEMSFSGNFIGAEQAERWGLVNRVVSPEELLGASARPCSDDLILLRHIERPGLLQQAVVVLERAIAVGIRAAVRMPIKLKRS